MKKVSRDHAYFFQPYPLASPPFTTRIVNTLRKGNRDLVPMQVPQEHKTPLSERDKVRFGQEFGMPSELVSSRKHCHKLYASYNYSRGVSASQGIRAVAKMLGSKWRYSLGLAVSLDELMSL